MDLTDGNTSLYSFLRRKITEYILCYLIHVMIIAVKESFMMHQLASFIHDPTEVLFKIHVREGCFQLHNLEADEKSKKASFQTRDL